MKIVWDDGAKDSLKKILVYCMDHFGQHMAEQFLNKLKILEIQLMTNPDRGFPESLLSGRLDLYRSLIIQKTNFKLVYRVMEKEEIVHIVDLWDTRREPKKLTERIK